MIVEPPFEAVAHLMGELRSSSCGWVDLYHQQSLNTRLRKILLFVALDLVVDDRAVVFKVLLDSIVGLYREKLCLRDLGLQTLQEGHQITLKLLDPNLNRRMVLREWRHRCCWFGLPRSRMLASVFYGKLHPNRSLAEREKQIQPR
jgi:hypothetical protein